MSSASSPSATGGSGTCAMYGSSKMSIWSGFSGNSAMSRSPDAVIASSGARSRSTNSCAQNTRRVSECSSTYASCEGWDSRLTGCTRRPAYMMPTSSRAVW